MHCKFYRQNILSFNATISLRIPIYKGFQHTYRTPTSISKALDISKPAWFTNSKIKMVYNTV